ncbi:MULTISPECIES: hypothetical protein [Halobacterium]|uniref:hypothetical protein n=1 Tax=Halobacterium TaxID=2239 RepID=UPI00073FA538|nr:MULTISPECIES: hypothetical protein [Halobacterium]MCG1001898.1 hypothetical protein [Halobacterium noricense]
MNPDDIVETFVSTILVVIMLVVAVTIWNQDIGMVLVDLLPQFIELAVWVFLGVIIAVLLVQLFENS